jgi:hypothetical protein
MSVRSTPYVLRSNDEAFEPIPIMVDGVPDFWIKTRVDFIEFLLCQLEKKRAEYKHSRLFAKHWIRHRYVNTPDGARFMYEYISNRIPGLKMECRMLDEQINNA